MSVGNNVTLIGRFTADPEMKTTPSGAKVVNFSLARNRPKDKNGETEADFFDCVAWSGTAELICQHFVRGNKIGIGGELRTRTWEDKNGLKRKTVEILVNGIEFVEKKNEGGNAVEHPAPETKTNTKNDSDGFVDAGEDDDGELPF